MEKHYVSPPYTGFRETFRETESTNNKDSAWEFKIMLACLKENTYKTRKQVSFYKQNQFPKNPGKI